MKTIFFSLLLLLLLSQPYSSFAQRIASFVTVRNHEFLIDDQPYYFIGANYWYGGIIANEEEGRQRVVTELDFLKSKGVTNLRILAGAEGVGPIYGHERVSPALQPQMGVFDTLLLQGLDFLLAEMGKRKMKAVIFLSNNWEWSGGFLQYLNWNGKLSDSTMQQKFSWDEYRNYVSKFYKCKPCRKQYNEQLKLVISRTNSITGNKYVNDPAIMSWEIANEPRPMRRSSIGAYKKWTRSTAALIKSLDKNHLVTIGSEGMIGSESMKVFKSVHANKNIDYATIHVWPKNWGWFQDTSIAAGFENVLLQTNEYIEKHIVIATALDKPLVIEEFGLPRDNLSFSLSSPTTFRDKYYKLYFEKVVESAQKIGVVAGSSFWAFSGIGRPSGKQLFWTKGDDMLGDPPMEEQGLNSVFDTDASTWELIEFFTKKLKVNSE